MDYLLCGVNVPSSSLSSTLELRQGLCFTVCPALLLVTSVMGGGKHVVGRNEPGMGRRKLTGRKECDC